MAPGAERFDVPPLRVILVVIMLGLGVAVAALEKAGGRPDALVLNPIIHAPAGIHFGSILAARTGFLFLDPFFVLSGVGPPILRANLFPPTAIGSATRFDTLVRHDC